MRNNAGKCSNSSGSGNNCLPAPNDMGERKEKMKRITRKKAQKIIEEFRKYGILDAPVNVYLKQVQKGVKNGRI